MKKILIVDQTPDMLPLLEKIVSDAGYFPLITTTIKEGLAWFSVHPEIKIVLLDIPYTRNLADDSIDFGKDILEKYPDVAVVFMSAGMDYDSQTRARSLTHFCLEKPFRARELIEMLEISQHEVSRH